MNSGNDDWSTANWTSSSIVSSDVYPSDALQCYIELGNEERERDKDTYCHCTNLQIMSHIHIGDECNIVLSPDPISSLKWVLGLN